MPRWLYSLLLYLLLPAATLWVAWRGWRNGANRERIGARLALGLPARTDSPLWLHAASVGELRALAALLRELGDAAAPVLVTVGTPTGLARARELFAADGHVSVAAAPWDLPGAVARFLAAMQPRAAVFIETELWPNLIAAAHAHGMPLALVSARLSSRSLRRYRRLAPALMRSTVRAFAAIGAQSEADRARFIELGAEPGRVALTGNLKFDLPQDAGQLARGAALRAAWAPQRPLWVAGSTHPHEEQLLLQAQRLLLAAAREKGAAAPLLAMAPRRPERFAAVARWLAAQPQLRHGCLSDPPSGTQRAGLDVLLIDAMGVLQEWYAAADVAFVGGSLVPVGGHNLIEPAALGKPVLTGPQVFNAPDVARGLLEAGAAQVVHDAAGLAGWLAAWSGEAGGAAGARGAAVVAAGRGAAGRAAALLTASRFRSGPSASG